MLIFGIALQKNGFFFPATAPVESEQWDELTRGSRVFHSL